MIMMIILTINDHNSICSNDNIDNKINNNNNINSNTSTDLLLTINSCASIYQQLPYRHMIPYCCIM